MSEKNPTGPVTATEIRQRREDRDRDHRARPGTYDYQFDAAGADHDASLTIVVDRGEGLELATMLTGAEAIVVYKLLKQIKNRTKTEPSNSTEGPSNRSENVPSNSG